MQSQSGGAALSYNSKAAAGPCKHLAQLGWRHTLGVELVGRDIPSRYTPRRALCETWFRDRAFTLQVLRDEEQRAVETRLTVIFFILTIGEATLNRVSQRRDGNGSILILPSRYPIVLPKCCS